MQITGRTGLHHAAGNGDVESIKALLEGGANMEIKDKVGDLIYCNS
jgi:ankyrin repeat protein